MLNSLISEIFMTPSSADANLPIPAGLPIPNRKLIRTWLIPLSSRQLVRPLMLIFIDTLLFCGGVLATVLFQSVVLKFLFAIFTGFVIGRIFILGHDACHQSFTPYRTLNKILGRIAFLPSLTPYSLWEVGHNIIHHGQTNLKGFDFVWAPMSLHEYKNLSKSGKILERIYRSGYGPALYYFLEMWWKKMYFPSRKVMLATRPEFRWDNIMVTIFAVMWNLLLAFLAFITNQSIILTIFMGFLIPFVFWNAMIGFVVYCHHTHPSVSWYSDKSEWLKAQPFVSTTVHLIFPFKWGVLMHHIMEHTAHHVDMSVPLYSLKSAQTKLEEMLPGRVIIQRFSWVWYFQTAKTCKLYDTNDKCWLDFDGNKTAESNKIVLSQ